MFNKDEDAHLDSSIFDVAFLSPMRTTKKSMEGIKHLPRVINIDSNKLIVVILEETQAIIFNFDFSQVI